MSQRDGHTTAVNWLNAADIAFIHEHCGTQAAQVN
jgi:hypothetical protein